MEFTTRFWSVLSQYFAKYTVEGRKLTVKEPNSIEIKGKIPDIVIFDERGTPQLIIETKRKVDGKPSEEFLDPLEDGPIAQAACYAVLAMEEYGLERTPLFATANRDVLVLFKGIKRDELGRIVNVSACLEPKKSPRDWIKSLTPEGPGILRANYIIALIENPLKEESIKKLSSYIGEWLINAPIPIVSFYRVLVDRLRGLIKDLHEYYVKDAVKDRILEDRDYFVRLFNKAKEAGYGQGLLSRGLFELKCPSHSKGVCEYLRELIRQKLELDRVGVVDPDKVFETLSSISRKSIPELCSEAEKSGSAGFSSMPLCRKPGTVKELISFDNLSKMMTYVLVNKILAYKILELHYGDSLLPLKPVYYGETVSIGERVFEIKSPSDLVSYLNYLFSYASSKLEEALKIKDYSPVFKTGLYDEIVLSGVESIIRVSAIISLLNDLKSELKYLPGIIGYVYEGLLPPRERHQLGQFYTPPAVARLIVKWAVRSGNDIILDAGCGSGTFLIEAYKRLLKLKFNKEYEREYPQCTEAYNEHQEVLNNLYGVDINAFASHITSIHLMLMEPRCPASRLNIDTRDFFTLRKVSQISGWRVEGFDAIIGNPPYTRWVEIPEGTKERILDALREDLKKYDLRADLERGREPGIYVYWIMHASKLLKDRGRIGMIISNMWLQTDYGVEFGNFLLDNFRIRALIDLPLRLFEALISTVIVLAEKEPDENTRNSNLVTLIRVPPRIFGEELDAEKAGKILDSILRCVEDAITSDGSIDLRRLAACRKEYGIHFVQVRQGDIPRDRKWISLFFADIESVTTQLERHPLMIKMGEWFEPSYGNALYLCLSSWGKVGGARNLGAKDFFYFSRGKVDEWTRSVPGFKRAVEPYLVPAITRSQDVKTFTFTEDDWRFLEKSGKDAYIFVCHKRREELPQEVQRYIEWGERECRTKIRRTRGGGRACSEAEACKAREGREGRKYFYGWYDLGGYLPAPIMAIRQARYHSQFFLSTIPVVTYDAIIAFIPKVKVESSFTRVNPEEYKQYIPESKPDITLDEKEIKAILAYLNSTFNWLWIEQNARYIAKGPLGLEVNIAREMPILNVKAINRSDVEALAGMFDELEAKARELAKSEEVKLELFSSLKSLFQSIDNKIAEILGIPVDVELLWSSAWEMMERRIKGAKGPTRPGAEVSIDAEIEERRRGKGRSERGQSSGTIISLDKWLK